MYKTKILFFFLVFLVFLVQFSFSQVEELEEFVADTTVIEFKKHKLTSSDFEAFLRNHKYFTPICDKYQIHNFEYFDKGFIRVHNYNNGEYQFYDTLGNAIIPPVEPLIRGKISDDFYYFSKENSTNRVKNFENQELFDLGFLIPEEYKYGLFKVFKNGQKGLGFIDSLGKEVLPLKYQILEEKMNSGIYAVAEKYTFPPEYRYFIAPLKRWIPQDFEVIEIFEEGLFIAKKEDKTAVYDYELNPVLNLNDWYFKIINDTLISFKNDSNQVVIYDQEKDKILLVQDDIRKIYGDHYYEVRSGSEYLLYNNKFQSVFEKKFKYIRCLESNCILMDKEDISYLYTGKNKLIPIGKILNCSLMETIFFGKLNGNFVVYDFEMNRLFTSDKYKVRSVIGNNLFEVEYEDQKLLIDKEEQIVLSHYDDLIWTKTDKRFNIFKKNGKMGLAHGEKGILFEANFDHIKDVGGGFFIFYDKEKRLSSLYHNSGKIMTEPIFSDVNIPKKGFIILKDSYRMSYLLKYDLMKKN